MAFATSQTHGMACQALDSAQSLVTQPAAYTTLMPTASGMPVHYVPGGSITVPSQRGAGAGPGAPPPQPQSLTAGLPDLAAIETQKAAYHTSLEEQMTQAEEILVRQQKEQTAYIYQAAEVQKRQVLNQIDQQAKEQELLLSQKYSQQLVTLQQQFMKQKIQLEKQANELSYTYQMRKMQEDIMQKHYCEQKALYDDKVKITTELQKKQRKEQLQQQPERWQYCPQTAVPIDIRKEPSIDGPRTVFTVQPGECFLVSEEREGTNGVLYLKLADGRGWLFDRKPDAGTMCLRQTRSTQTSLPHALANGQVTLASASGQLPATPTQVLPAGVAQLNRLDQSYAAAHVQPQVLHVQAHTSAATSSQWIYCPEISALMAIRSTPEVDGPRTPHMLQPGEVFVASEELQGRDGVLYLKLADGRGWVFDRKPEVGIMCVRQTAAARDDCTAAKALRQQAQHVESASAVGQAVPHATYVASTPTPVPMQALVTGSATAEVPSGIYVAPATTHLAQPMKWNTPRSST
uniref:Uncharacterized protein n=1 Tax=Pyrodinium bahamense TaxID=73915 RepID=A0A7S0AFL6_9DINO|mmetsp:Transcript_33447/g.92597  ORF Transcript_33447/g.92597 Transcript_33447/m.92597 type:complete len:519 (+) Transcript_33447:108-1664(+)